MAALAAMLEAWAQLIADAVVRPEGRVQLAQLWEGEAEVPRERRLLEAQRVGHVLFVVQVGRAVVEDGYVGADLRSEERRRSGEAEKRRRGEEEKKG